MLFNYIDNLYNYIRISICSPVAIIERASTGKLCHSVTVTGEAFECARMHLVCKSFLAFSFQRAIAIHLQHWTCVSRKKKKKKHQLAETCTASWIFRLAFKTMRLEWWIYWANSFSIPYTLLVKTKRELWTTFSIWKVSNNPSKKSHSSLSWFAFIEVENNCQIYIISFLFFINTMFNRVFPSQSTCEFQYIYCFFFTLSST